MEIFTILLAGLTLLLLIGTTKKFKLYTGGIVVGAAALFIIGEIIIKVQTGFYRLGKQEWYNQGYAETMGKMGDAILSLRGGDLPNHCEHPDGPAVSEKKRRCSLGLDGMSCGY